MYRSLFDLLVAEADADDCDAAFPFGQCHCGCALEENGECPDCIQREIDEKKRQAAVDPAD
jgi:hypothetical protein